jgi:Cu(I)/Ag(I) efflux system protein CusF
MKSLWVFAIAALVAAGGAGACETGVKHSHNKPLRLAPAEVRAINFGEGTVTLHEAAIDSAGIPASTLVYRAAKPSQIKSLKAGDKVRFRAEEISGTLTVLEIRKAQRR